MNEAYIDKWIEKADNDLKAAEILFNVDREEMVTDVICFHCEQVVEKYLKAYLISRKVEFKKTHNIEYLLELCKAKDPDFGGIEVGDLSMYAVEVR